MLFYIWFKYVRSRILDEVAEIALAVVSDYINVIWQGAYIALLFVILLSFSLLHCSTARICFIYSYNILAEGCTCQHRAVLQMWGVLPTTNNNTSLYTL